MRRIMILSAASLGVAALAQAGGQVIDIFENEDGRLPALRPARQVLLSTATNMPDRTGSRERARYKRQQARLAAKKEAANG